MALTDIGWTVMCWIHVAQDRDHWMTSVNTVTNLWVP
jgi:hypothetical protein